MAKTACLLSNFDKHGAKFGVILRDIGQRNPQSPSRNTLILLYLDDRSDCVYLRGKMAGETGLEPAASGVTSRRYNQLNYSPASEEWFYPGVG